MSGKTQVKSRTTRAIAASRRSFGASSGEPAVIVPDSNGKRNSDPRPSEITAAVPSMLAVPNRINRKPVISGRRTTTLMGKELRSQLRTISKASWIDIETFGILAYDLGVKRAIEMLAKGCALYVEQE